MRWLAVSIAGVLVLLACTGFNETGPTTTPPEIAAPTGRCDPVSNTPNNPDLTYDASDSSFGNDGSVQDGGADVLDGGQLALDATADAADVYVPSQPPYQPYCEPPYSVCANSEWIAYFDDGRCVDGTCFFTTKYHYCPGGCVNNLCAAHRSVGGGGGGTAPLSPPKW